MYRQIDQVLFDTSFVHRVLAELVTDRVVGIERASEDEIQAFFLDHVLLVLNFAVVDNSRDLCH